MASKYASYGINAAFSAAALCEGFVRMFELHDFEGAVDSFTACMLSVVPAAIGYEAYGLGMMNSPNLLSGVSNSLEVIGFVEFMRKPSCSLTYNIAPLVMGGAALANAADFFFRDRKR